MTALPRHLFGGEVVALAHGRFRLGLAPALGGSVVYFAEERDDGPRHWFRPASREALASGTGHRAACFPLVPVSGRVADAVLAWEGEEIVLPRNFAPEPNHVHGEGWQRPWRVESVEADRAALLLDHGSPAWPFPYSARFEYRLGDSGLSIDMAVTNRGDRDMPAAIGVHPWFPAPLAELTARCDTLWEIDARKLFAGKKTPPPHRRFAVGRTLEGADLEHGFTSWDGVAALRWPGRPGTLKITASGTLRHLVVYTRDPTGDFCVEPVSCSVDAFNLHARGIEDTGTAILSPGETLAGSASFTIEG